MVLANRHTWVWKAMFPTTGCRTFLVLLDISSTSWSRQSVANSSLRSVRNATSEANRALSKCRTLLARNCATDRRAMAAESTYRERHRSLVKKAMIRLSSSADRPKISRDM